VIGLGRRSAVTHQNHTLRLGVELKEFGCSIAAILQRISGALLVRDRRALFEFVDRGREG